MRSDESPVRSMHRLQRQSHDILATAGTAQHCPTVLPIGVDHNEYAPLHVFKFRCGLND
jgi:hypothetical protein